MRFRLAAPLIFVLLLCSCTLYSDNESIIKDPNLTYQPYQPNPSDIVISRNDYFDKLHGFWLAQCIGNWTGLITEMDKIGGEGKNGKAAGFYTREHWGGPDQPNLWGKKDVSDTIDFVFVDPDGIWGADDDTDIEYIYQHLMYVNSTSKLSGKQIAEGWLKHIYSDENTPFHLADGTPENYLWISNQKAHDLMRAGELPPATSHPDKNPHYEMIDAQLTTEIFGLFAPGRPDIATKIAHLPVQTTARKNAECIAKFYISMYALASRHQNLPMKDRVFKMAEASKTYLPSSSYSSKMYDFVKVQYESGLQWEEARDALHEKYQVRQEDGYEWSTRDEVCNGCFAAGINFGASLIALFYGEGDLKETIKIGTLVGWDSDNPTATWAGMLGFMLGKEGVEKVFDRRFANQFNIHRTRGGFENDGIDTFENMAEIGVFVTDRVVQEQLGGGVDLINGTWYIPLAEKKSPGISLAEWSLHTELFANRIDHLDFPRIARDSFDIAAVEFVSQFFQTKAEDFEYLQQLKDSCSRYAVKSHLIMIDGEGHLGAHDEDERVKSVYNHVKWIKAAGFLGCSAIRVNGTGFGTDEQVKASLVKSLNELAPIGAKYKIKILVENHGMTMPDGSWNTKSFATNSRNLQDVMESVDQEWIGVLPDFGNFVDSDPYESVRELSPYAYGISAKTVGFDETGEDVKIDFKRMFEVIDLNELEGYIGIEYEAIGEDSELSEYEAIRLSKKLIQKTAYRNSN